MSLTKRERTALVTAFEKISKMSDALADMGTFEAGRNWRKALMVIAKAAREASEVLRREE